MSIMNEQDIQKHVNSFIGGWSGARLLKEHDLSEFAEWEVRGEDPNCDLGGSHSNPYLGKVKGTLGDAIRWGVQQSGWFQWGSGGTIRKSNDAIKIGANMEKTFNVTINLSVAEAKTAIAEYIGDVGGRKVNPDDVKFNVILAHEDRPGGSSRPEFTGITAEIKQ